MKFSQQAYDEAVKIGKNFVLYEEFSTDLVTPVSCLINIAKYNKYYCLFESVTGGEKKGRYSIIATSPDQLWKCEKGNSYTSSDLGENYSELNEKDVFNSLREFIAKSKIDMPDNLPFGLQRCKWRF